MIRWQVSGNLPLSLQPLVSRAGHNRVISFWAEACVPVNACCAPGGLRRRVMGRFGEVAYFVSAANRVTAQDELRALLDGLVRSLGFDYYALVHHAGMVRANERLVRLHDFPEDWEGIIR